MRQPIELETREGWKYLNDGPPNNEPLPLDARIVTYASGILDAVLARAWYNSQEGK